MTRATILVPTHNHASTLPLAVGSALTQTVTDLEVLIIGDGVTPEVRAAALALVATDARVRFIDRPKGAFHGEIYRGDAILEATSDAIFYLCDDDLLMRDHVADLLALLEDYNFVLCKNGYFTADGEQVPYAGDLRDPEFIAMHLDEELPHNGVGMTGVAHSRTMYLEIGEPWETTPDGEFADRHQWQRMMRHPQFRGATSHRMTALTFPSSQDGRDTWTPEQRRAELLRWVPLTTSAEGQAHVDELVARGDRGQLMVDLVTIRMLLRDRRRRGQAFAQRAADIAYRIPGLRRRRAR